MHFGFAGGIHSTRQQGGLAGLFESRAFVNVNILYTGKRFPAPLKAIRPPNCNVVIPPLHSARDVRPSVKSKVLLNPREIGNKVSNKCYELDDGAK